MKTILIVDDKPETLDTVEECLSGSGFRIVTIADGRLALSAIREGLQVDLVIADCWMQGMDGLDFLARLKEITPAVPVVIFSDRVSIECYLKSLSLGAFEYLTEPIEAKELERIVEAAFDNAGSGRMCMRQGKA